MFLVVLIPVPNHNSPGSFQPVVEFVLPELRSVLSHGGIDPVGMLGPVPILVVVNKPESVSEFFGVDLRVQSISGCAEDG